MRTLLAVLAASTAGALSAQSFTNFESGPVGALRLSPDGTRLFAADTTGGRVVVFDLANPSMPLLRAEIPVGVDPVSVQPRTRDEVWVANVLSDSVDVVSVAAGRVIDTLPVVDEPSDIVFAGGKAFVSAAASDRIAVFDAASRAPLGSVPVFGKDPRALAVAPSGAHVYAVVQRSGNGTTVLPANLAPPPPPPTNAALPPAPAQGLIVRADDPAWAAQIPYSLPDYDVVEIDVATLAVTRALAGVGTTNTGIAVHPTSGELWVANTDARNLVRFEPNLRGHVIDSRLTRITTGSSPVVTPFDLNPGINYAQLPNAMARSTALSEPFGVAIDVAAGLVYVAAQGTDRIGVVGLDGAVQDRIEIGVTPGAIVDSRHKRGPRALALHAAAQRLYVLNRLTDTISVVDTAARTVLRELPLATWDPMPAVLREGRKFLYDAKLSGNGTLSCASCHVDGDIDGLVWDLGDPDGSMSSPPAQPFPFNLGLLPFHPMKGPMATQTLRGLAGTGLLHWRGDRADFAAFNPTFMTLLGGAQLAAADMADFAAFAAAITMPPNPNQQLDRSYRTTPAANNEAAGLAAFLQPIPSVPLPGGASCALCHPLATTTNGRIVSATFLQLPQQLESAQLRNAYRKLGFMHTVGPQKSGFGFTHDGAVDTLTSFLQRPLFNPWPAALKDDLETFLLSLDTGTAPAVGYQFTLDASNANGATAAADLQLVTTRASAGDIDLTAHGTLQGELTGLLYDTTTNTFLADRSAVGPFTGAQLVAFAAAGQADLAFTAVPPGSGARIARDRDLDGVLNGDERADVYGQPTPGCAGASTFVANSEARVGNSLFGCTVDNAPPNFLALAVLSLGATSLPALGVQILVDPATAVPLLIASDVFGESGLPFAIPPSPSNVGTAIHAQALWLDPCGVQLWSSSAGLKITIRG